MAKAFNPKRLLLVHAHPDDESLFTGHVIAQAIRAGAEVMVFTLTRGERGRMKLQELKSLEGNLAAMGQFRNNELQNALKALGTESNPVKHAFAGTRAYLDSGLRINSMGRPAKRRNLDEMALVSVSTTVIADDIERVMNSFKPDAVVTYNRKGGFGHPDHKRAFEATSMAIRHYSRANKSRKPQFWVIAEPRERFDVSIGGDSTAAIKKAALEAHASQVLIGAETYSLVEGRPFRYNNPERLRRVAPSKWLVIKPWLKAVWGLPLGVGIAILGTMLHQNTLNTSDGQAIGLAIALSMVGIVSLSLRFFRNSAGALYLYALGFLVTISQLGQRQDATGGEIFIPANTNGMWWTYGSTVIIAIIVLFPRLRRATWKTSARGHR